MATVQSKTSSKVDDLLDDTLASARIQNGSLYTTTKGGIETLIGSVAGTGDTTSIWYDVTDYNVRGDGATNDSVALNAAITACGNQILYFPPGVYSIDATVAVNQAGQRWVGNGATLSARVFSEIPYHHGVNPITITALREITGFTIDYVSLRFLSTFVGPCDVHGNKFTHGANPSIFFGADITGTGTRPSQVHVHHNTFLNHDYAIYGACDHSVLSDNQFYDGVIAGTRNIELHAGSYNRIESNDINSGTTGIVFLLNPASGQVGRAKCEENVISGNTFKGVTEECISLDSGGSGGGPQLVGTIASGLALSAGGHVQFVPSFSLSVDQYTNLTCVMTSGKAKGRSPYILSQGSGGNSVLELDDTDLDSYTVGDTIAVGLVAKGFTISGNTCDGNLAANSSGIALWGSACDNTVVGNRVSNMGKQGIEAATLFGLNAQFNVAPSFNNVISGNVLNRANISVRGWSGGTSYPFNAIGNLVTGNMLLNTQLQYTYQDAFLCYDNVQIGGTQDIHDVGLKYPPTGLIDLDFETATVAENFTSVTDAGGGLSIDSAASYHGTKSLKIDGTTAYGATTIAAGNKYLAVRFAFLIDTLPSGAPAAFRLINASGNFEMDLMSTGRLTFAIGAGTTSPTFVCSTGVWYLAEMACDATTGTASMTFQVTRLSDNTKVIQSSMTRAQAAADFTEMRVGSLGAIAQHFHFDSLLMTTSSSDYPIGAPFASSYYPVSGGSWQVGQRVPNPLPKSGQPYEWLCTVAGAPGTWVGLGNLS